MNFAIGNFTLDIYREPCIEFDIWHPTVGLRCTIPPKHLSQLKAWTIPLI